MDSPFRIERKIRREIYLEDAVSTLEKSVLTCECDGLVT